MEDEKHGREIPPDLWKEIGKRLESRLDIARFRSVCKSWRSSLPSPTRFPLRVPPPPVDYNSLFQKMPFFITEQTVYVVDTGRTGSVLAVFEDVDQGDKFHSLALLPAEKQVPTAFPFPKVSHKSDDHLSHLSFVSKSYRLRVAIPRFNPGANERVEGKWYFRPVNNVVKIVLVSSDPNSANPYYASESDLAVVALLKGGKLALLKLAGSHDPLSMNWETNFSDCVYNDIVSYKDKLCAVDRQGRAFVMDYNSLQMTQIAPPLFSMELPLFAIAEFAGGESSFLVESCGDLYLLVQRSRWFLHGVNWRVYKLHLYEWLEVESLDNEAFFVNVEESFSAPRNILARNRVMRSKRSSSIFVDKAFYFLSYPVEYGNQNEAQFPTTRVCLRSYIPWLSGGETTATATTTSMILSQYDELYHWSTYRDYRNFLKGNVA